MYGTLQDEIYLGQFYSNMYLEQSNSNMPNRFAQK